VSYLIADCKPTKTMTEKALFIAIIKATPKDSNVEATGLGLTGFKKFMPKNI
jgi:hypothetical protein